MQLRSGHTTNLQTSSNYQNEENSFEKKWKNMVERLKFLLSLSEYERKNNYSFTQKIKTIKEIYKVVLYNMDDLIILFNGKMKYNKKLAQAFYNKGNQLRVELSKCKRTRYENQLANECNDIINRVTQRIYRFILSN